MTDIRLNKLLHNFKENKKVFEELYEYFFPRISVYIGRRYGDEGFGEDIAQEFFLKIRNISIPEKIEHPTAWVMKVCDNLAKTLRHKEPRTVEWSEETLAVAVEDNYADLKNGGISEENIAALKELDKLTLEILVMHYWEGYKFIEIAEILNLQYDAVKRRHSRALKKLNKIILTRPFLLLLLSLLK